MATLGMAMMPEYPMPAYARLAKEIEDLGYENLWVPDERFWRDLATCMSRAVLATEDVKVGSSVTDPFVRHPALTAQMMASLDELSGGRIVVGIGAGIAGFKAMGIERRRPVQAIREAVELMRLLWTGDVVDYEGEIVQFHEASLDFTPLRPDIPIYIAGRGPLVLSLAGEIGDGVMIGSLASAPGLSYAMQRVEEGLKRAGRDREEISVTLWLHTAISEDGEAAVEAVRNIVTGVLVSSLNVLDQFGIEIPEKVKEAMQGVTYGVNSPSMRRAKEVVGPDVIRHFAVAGSPEEVGRRFAEIAAAGVDHFAVLPWLTESQRLEEFAALLKTAVEPAAA